MESRAKCVNLGPIPSARWSAAMRRALDAAEVVDLPLPRPEDGPSDLGAAVAAVVARVPGDAARVLVDGEPTVVFRAVEALRRRGFACYAPAADPTTPEARVRPFPGAEDLAMEERVVAGRRVAWPRGHLLAHEADLLLPLDELLAEVVARLPDPLPAGPFSVSGTLDRPVGWSRLVALEPGDRTWWGRRPGRRVPSHLVDAPPRATRAFTAWLRSEADGRLRLDTLYAGRSAPREIHDPELPLDEVDASIAFWTRHALSAAAPADTARP